MTKNTVSESAIIAFVSRAFTGHAIDTSSLIITDYITADASCAQLAKQGVKKYELVDGTGAIVPGARERITYTDGTIVESSPFFTFAVAAIQATVPKIKSGSAGHLEYAQSGIIKTGGYPFLPSKEVLDALIAADATRFTEWLGEYKPTAELLAPLYAAYSKGPGPLAIEAGVPVVVGLIHGTPVEILGWAAEIAPLAAGYNSVTYRLVAAVEPEVAAA